MSIERNAFMRALAALSAGMALAACTMPREAPAHAAHHPGQAAGAPAPASMGGGQSGAATAGAPASADRPASMDMQRMCQMHQDMHKAPAGERQAMMEQRMKGMSPEMRQQHMDMMQQHCK